MTEFHIAKIGNAITRAFEAVGRQYHPSVIELLALRVTAEFEPKIRNEPDLGRRYSGLCGARFE